MYHKPFEEMTTLPAPVGYQPRTDRLVPCVSRVESTITATPEVPKKAKAKGHQAQNNSAWANVEGQALAALHKIAGPHGATYARPERVLSECPGRTIDQIKAALESLRAKREAVKRRGMYRIAKSTR